MEALKDERLLDSGNKDDRVRAPTAGLILYMASAIGRLKMPGWLALPSGVASKQTLERFELMLQCGF
jgi:hypothetical protein